MPAKKGNTPDKIKNTARTIFLANGFRETSMQMIASEVGISAPGLYKYFESKEEIFSALVDPLITAIKEILHMAENEKDTLFAEGKSEKVWDKEKTFKEMLDFIYANFSGMKLLLFCAEGTAYENIIDKVADYETQVMLRTLPRLREQGMDIPEIDAETISTMMRQQYRTHAEFIRKDYPRERAEQYQKEVDTFFTAGWRALLRF
jgi:AcrR family transcriptional regulator